MKKKYPKLFFIASLFCFSIVQAQLHIQPVASGSSEAYVYNSGEIIYVDDYISLDGGANSGEGNIYLRDEGQLMQGVMSSSSNTGQGVTSVYQTGTVNRWDYHYWTSPVGNTGASTGNETFNMQNGASGGGLFSGIIDERFSAISGFIGGYDGVPSSGIDPARIAQYWFYKFVNGQDYFDYVQIQSTGMLNPGEGFTMKGVGTGTTVPQQYDFRGRPNSGDIAISVNANRSSLVGNPYPSAMNLSYYLLYNSGQSLAGCDATTYSIPAQRANAVITGIAYFWDSDPAVRSHYLEAYQGGYGTYSPAMSCNANDGMYTPASFSMYDWQGNPTNLTGGGGGTYERNYAPIGQGFFVEGDPSAPANSFTIAKNEFRAFVKESSNVSQFKSSEKNPRKAASTSLESQAVENTAVTSSYARLKIESEINDVYVRVNGIVFHPDATMGYDRAGDGANITPLANDINFSIENREEPFVINVLPYDPLMTIPLQINATDQSVFKIKVSEINFETPYGGVWIHDKVEDLYYNILNQKQTVDIAQGTYNNRYELVFATEENLDVEDIEESTKSIDVYQDNNAATLYVLNPESKQIKEIAVFDILGKQIVGKLNENSNSKITIPTSSWSDGVYIVKVVIFGDQEMTKKISINN